MPALSDIFWKPTSRTFSFGWTPPANWTSLLGSPYPLPRHCVSPRITDGDSPKVLEIDLNVMRSLCADGIPDEAEL